MLTQILLNWQHKVISRIFLNHSSLPGKTYFLIRKITLKTRAQMFQYKVLHNILQVTKMLFKFGKVTSPWYFFCKLHDETIMHLFYDCLIVERIWNQLKSALSNNLNFLIGMPGSWGGWLVLPFLFYFFSPFICFNNINLNNWFMYMFFCFTFNCILLLL